MSTCKFIKQFIDSESFKSHRLKIFLKDGTSFSAEKYFDTESQKAFSELLGEKEELEIPKDRLVLFSTLNYQKKFHFVTDEDIDRYTIEHDRYKNSRW
ncbi:hypothetical protein HCA69_02555 [Listeria grandensis]|uniref:Uncharacterized protein n=1 Tax=Listeria grandensis TaxID=1494963 RepID=A0A7X1CNQ3_9LIST|nr:hypothetical protein [Listeria grandensis]MBC1935230.1 hypothetical protein [Listeria grandensis]